VVDDYEEVNSSRRIRPSEVMTPSGTQLLDHDIASLFAGRS